MNSDLIAELARRELARRYFFRNQLDFLPVSLKIKNSPK